MPGAPDLHYGLSVISSFLKQTASFTPSAAYRFCLDSFVRTNLFREGFDYLGLAAFRAEYTILKSGIFGIDLEIRPAGIATILDYSHSFLLNYTLRMSNKRYLT